MKVAMKRRKTQPIFVVVLAIAINLAVWSGFIWLAGSALASGIKSVSDDCGKVYGAEEVFSGDWFCPE